MTEPLLIRGDARRLPLSDASVDLIVTSPPYYSLRSYTDGGEHYDGQIGAEPTPAAYIESLIACTAEWAQVLKPSGSMFINLGDKYVSSPSGPQGKTGARAARTQAATYAGVRTRQRTTASRTRQKSLMLLPERYRIAATDELGLIARAVIVWSKLNGIPEKVTDRVRRSHEDWVHLTKMPKYYEAVDELREPALGPDVGLTYEERIAAGEERRPTRGTAVGTNGNPRFGGHPLGRVPSSVWEIALQPLALPPGLGVDHYAAFPMEWPRRLIRGWCPRDVCTACGQGRHPVTAGAKMVTRPSARRIVAQATGNAQRTSTSETMLSPPSTTIIGYACACPDISAPSTPGVVLDPFGGTGTTALVAAMNGRIGISVDFSDDYNRWAARWRINDVKERARAAGYDADTVSAIARPLPGQFDVFGTEVLG